jgi:hypothetical protein
MILKKKTIIITFIIFKIIVIFLLYGLFNYTNFFETFEDKGQSSKIAFLFLTYNNLNRPDIWNKFLDSKTNRFTIYNHAKEPANVTDSLLSKRHISENIETCWGCFGTVEANILMLKEALKDKLNKKFILVSDSCIPIVPFDDLYKELMKDDKSIINIFYNQMQRYDQIIKPQFSKDKFTKSAAQGLVFNRKHAELLVTSLEHYKNNWKNMECVDEHYFCNILRELDPNFELNNKNNKFTFDIWNKDEIWNKNENININNEIIFDTKLFASIQYMSNKAINNIRRHNFMFVRKVIKNTEIDVDYILSLLN